MSFIFKGLICEGEADWFRQMGGKRMGIMYWICKDAISDAMELAKT
jgi:hypothetical protein